MSTTFKDLFRSDNITRDKFLARIFGVFSEEIVRCWAKGETSPYEDLGRPTVKLLESQSRGSTLDFTFRSKNDGRVYIAEMKCWLEYQNYRFLPLKGPEQLREADNPAFRLFLIGAKNPSQITVAVNGKLQPIDGSILVWSGCSEQVRATIKAAYGLRDVLSLEEIIADLVTKQNEDFAQLLRDRKAWAEHLFSGLLEIDWACWRLPSSPTAAAGNVPDIEHAITPWGCAETIREPEGVSGQQTPESTNTGERIAGV